LARHHAAAIAFATDTAVVVWHHLALRANEVASCLAGRGLGRHRCADDVRCGDVDRLLRPEWQEAHAERCRHAAVPITAPVGGALLLVAGLADPHALALDAVARLRLAALA